MTGGMAFEGLNNLGHSGRDCIIVLNDNGRSYAPTVSPPGREPGAASATTRSTCGARPGSSGSLQEIPVVGERLERGLDATKAAIREMWEPHRVLRDARRALHRPLRRPRHRRPRGGACATPPRSTGPRSCTCSPRRAGATRRPRTTRSSACTTSGRPKPGSYTAAFTEALIKEAEEHPELVAITAAMPDSTGLLPFAERFPDRCFDVGIAEQHAVTSAAGMAMGGLRPVVAVYSTFLTRAFDQVNLDVGLHRQPVVFCLDRAGITGDDGPSHHGVLDMVLLTKVPGMTMFAPSSYQELQADAPRRPGPHRRARSRIRWPKTAARQGRPSEVGSRPPRPPAARRATTCASSRSARCSTPPRRRPTLLEADGVSVTVWDARVVKPLDPDMLADAARHPCVLTVEDGLREGGVGCAIADQLAELTLGEPRAAGAGARHAGRLHPPRQARRHPRRARPRRRRHHRLGGQPAGRRPHPPQLTALGTPTRRADAVRLRCRRGSRRRSWSVASMISVTSGIASLMATWMPSRSVAALIAQPWQPPPMVRKTLVPSTPTSWRSRRGRPATG